MLLLQKNVGTIDAIMRISFGLLGLAYGAGKMSRRPYRTPGFLMFFSAMKVAEGVTRFCPMLKLMGVSTRKEDMLRMMLDKTISSVTKSTTSAQHKNKSATSTSSNHSAQQHNIQNAENKAPQKDITDQMVENVAAEITKAVVQSEHAGSAT